MTKESLQQILSTAYNHTKWGRVLTEFFGVRDVHRIPVPVSLPKNEIADAAWEIGSFATTDDRIVGLYQVDLNRQPRIWQNRVGLRSLLRDVYRHDVDAVLVVFVRNDKWRLSLISEIRVRDPETGEIVEQKTEPKRYTYLLGEGETVRTPVERLDDFRSSSQSLESLIKAFSVEALNKDFFREYKIVFDDLVTEVGKKIKDKETARLFAQRLLNRLMFLYFIQKKEWMSYAGDTNYLRRIFDEAVRKKQNFYPDRLYYVFFYGLSNHAESKEIHNKSELREIRGEVPYLNGGLFEPEKDGLDAKGEVPISNERFAEILQLFERYNFTVDESTPFEIQVAVDPEMLGKVFEELVTGRHESGSYYTPRTVVSFMCREALKHALEGIEAPDVIAKLVDLNDGKLVTNPEKILERLRALKVCDPACGSGAYLLGMLQELLHVREALFASTAIAKDAQYKWKREIIENNIYGVDLDRFATQIAALRLWLSLAIESEEPKPLPNLKYKIGCGDSLLAPLETDLQPNLHRRALIEQFRARKKEYTDADNHLEKAVAEAEVERLRIEIARALNHLPEPPSDARLLMSRNETGNWERKVKDALNRGDKWKAEQHQKNLNKLLSEIAEMEALLGVEHYDTGTVFDWSVEFAEVFEDGGFDIVLANPPYVQLQINGGHLAKLYEVRNFQTFARTGDLYSLFYERGFELLKKNGVLSYITSNKWMRAKYGEKTRKFFAERTRPLLIIDFGGAEIFSSATVDNNILMLQKASQKTSPGLIAARTGREFDFSSSMRRFVEENGYNLSSINQNAWVIGEKDEFDVKRRVEDQGIPLEDSSWQLRINYGVKTGYNDAFIISAHVKQAIDAEAKRNHGDRSSTLLKPLLRGRDIKAWFPEYDDLYLIATFPSLRLDIDKYPAIKKHLLSIGFDRLEQSGRPGSRKRTGNNWFETQDQISYWRDFEQPKIAYPNMTKYLPFIYDEFGFYTNDKAFIITGKSLKYLTCFFNSKLFKYCFSNNFPNLGEDRRELRKVFFEKIPVKQLRHGEEQPFNDLVDWIIYLKRRIYRLKDDSAQRPAVIRCTLLEQIADALILELYLAEDFDRYKVAINEKLPVFPQLLFESKNDTEVALNRVFQELDDISHPIRVNLSAMKSIPVVQLIYNTVRI